MTFFDEILERVYQEQDDVERLSGVETDDLLTPGALPFDAVYRRLATRAAGA